MNYIAGYIYIIARQEEETFILFDLIMNKYFSNIFNNQF